MSKCVWACLSKSWGNAFPAPFPLFTRKTCNEQIKSFRRYVPHSHGLITRSFTKPVYLGVVTNSIFAMSKWESAVVPQLAL